MANKRYPGVYPDKDGTYYIKPRIKDVFGKTKQTTIRGFKTQKEASETKQEMQNKVTMAESSYVSYEQVFKENLEFKLQKGKIGKSTYNSCLGRNTLHILPEIGNINIYNLTAENYKNLQIKLKDKCLNIRTINGLHSDVVSTLKYATLFYKLEYNVAMMIGPLYKDRDNINSFTTLDDMKKIDKENSLSPEEWEKMIKIFETKIQNTNDIEDKNIYIKDMLFFVCEYILMMRIGEVQALSYDAILFDKKVIFLNKAYSKGVKDITPLKNRKTRFIYLPENVLNLFKYCLGEDRKFNNFKTTNYIFGWTNHFSRTNVLRRLKNVQKEAGIEENLTNHKLRHASISDMLYEKQDPTAIATMAGHNKEMTLNVYNQTLEKATQNLVTNLDKLYVPKI